MIVELIYPIIVIILFIFINRKFNLSYKMAQKYNKLKYYSILFISIIIITALSGLWFHNEIIRYLFLSIRMGIIIIFINYDKGL